MDNNQNNGYFDRSSEQIPNGNMASPLSPLAPDAAHPTSGMAVGALICGILSIIFGCCCGVGILPAIIGMILALVDRKRNAGFGGVALAGLICSIIGGAISLLLLVSTVAVIVGTASDPEFMSIYQSMLEAEEEIIVY